MRPVRAPLVAALLVVTLAACGGGGGEPDVAVVGAAQAAVPVAGSSQVVVTLENTGDGDDTLVSASTDVALGVELHRTDISDGTASMDELDEVPVPAGEQVRFRPGETHLMLVVPDSTVVEGGTFELTLELERSGALTFPVTVVPLLDLAEGAVDEDAS